jgi:hypothetical protein
MITVHEATSALYGASRLARFDGSGSRYFDDSLRGFWHSFYAAALAAPFYAVLVYADFSADPDQTDLFRYGLAQALGYVVGWVIFPLAMIGVSRLLDRETKYVRYIVAYNWSAVVQAAVFTPFGMLSGFSGPELSWASFPAILAMGYLLVYAWFVAKEGLAITSFQAVAIVALDQLLSFILSGVVHDIGTRVLLDLG